MEILVPILGALMGAAATIIAAYLQANRSNLHSASEKKLLNREMSVSISAPLNAPEKATVVLEDKPAKGEKEEGDHRTIQARPAFLDDLGCEPIEGELLLFLRKGRFKASHPDSPWFAGWIVVTNCRVVCRTLPRLDDFRCRPVFFGDHYIKPHDNQEMWSDNHMRVWFGRRGYTHPAGVLADGNAFKAHKARLQDRKTVLLEGKPFDQLFMQVDLGLFESPDKVLHTLVATIQVAAKG